MTAESGIVDREGRGLGVVVADLDDDGKPDIYVANDMSANNLYRNLGGFRFEDVGEASGAAIELRGGLPGGHGHCLRRLRRRRPARPGRDQLLWRVGLAVPEPRRRPLRRLHGPAGLAAPTRFVLGFGASFLDANNDGRIDLAVANGHVNDYRPAIPYAMPAQLFLGAGGGHFVDASARRSVLGRAPGRPRPGRGRPGQ